MAGAGTTTGGAQQKAAQAKQKAAEAKQGAQRTIDKPWAQGLVRFGYIVRGVLYGLVGLLAVQVALGAGGQTTDKNGAIATLAAQPFGFWLLILVAIGLAGYSLWGFVRAIFDPLDRGSDPKGIAQRIGYVVSGLSYGSLFLLTLSYLLGHPNNKGGGGSQDFTANLLHQPFGPWLVGIVGLIGIGGGLGQIYQGVTAKFKDDFKQGEMSPQEMEWAVRIGRFGLMARGVVFAMLGFFVLQAALHIDPKQVKGFDGALQTLAQQPSGPWLLAIVAFGLVAFGIYSALCAKWIRIGRR